jgi:branched-chain amino acid transport system substrate-binding protein
MPHMTPPNSADYLTKKLDNPYFFQMGPLGSTQILTLMAYNKKNNFKRVALVKDNSGLGTFLGKIFKDSLEKSGTEVVVEQTIEVGSTDAIPQMQKVRAAKPQAIYHSGIVVSAMATFFKAYHQLGMKQPVLGSFNLSVPQYLEVIPGMLEGVAFIDAYDPDKKETKAFIEKYKKVHGKEPFSLPAYGYDGLNVIADAIRRAGSTDNEKLRAALAATKGYVGVLGAKGTSVDFSADRAGFPKQGAVVRVIQNNTHGPVVHSGY